MLWTAWSRFLILSTPSKCSFILKVIIHHYWFQEPAINMYIHPAWWEPKIYVKCHWFVNQSEKYIFSPLGQVWLKLLIGYKGYIDLEPNIKNNVKNYLLVISLSLVYVHSKWHYLANTIISPKECVRIKGLLWPWTKLMGQSVSQSYHK